jgi:nucleoside-diphosphate-sugar epimerase
MQGLRRLGGREMAAEGWERSWHNWLTGFIGHGNQGRPFGHDDLQEAFVAGWNARASVGNRDTGTGRAKYNERQRGYMKARRMAEKSANNG